MKKTSILITCVTMISALFITGCGNSNSVAKVAPEALMDSGATSDIASDEDFMGVMSTVSEDDGFQCLVSELSNGMQNLISLAGQNTGAYLASYSNGDKKSVDINDEAEILENKFQKFESDLTEKGKASLSYEQSFDSLDLNVPGLDLSLPKVQFNVKATQNKDSTKVSVDLDFNIKYSDTFSMTKFCKAYEQEYYDEVNSVIRYSKDNIAMSGRISIKTDENGQPTGTIKMNMTSATGTSICSEEGVGGKVISNGSISFDGTYEELLSFITTLESQGRDLSGLKDCPIKINFSVKSYNDENKETYSAKCNDFKELYDNLQRYSKSNDSI
jgi:hypothetical protein